MDEEKNQMLEELKLQLGKAQNGTKNQAYQNKKEMNYKERDMGYLKFQPHRLKSVANRTNQKLNPGHYGSHEVIERIGAVSGVGGTFLWDNFFPRMSFFFFFFFFFFLHPVLKEYAFLLPAQTIELEFREVIC